MVVQLFPSFHLMLLPFLVQVILLYNLLYRWALGILLYNMMFGAPPFMARSREEEYRGIRENRPKFPSRVVSACCSLAKVNMHR